MMTRRFLLLASAACFALSCTPAGSRSSGSAPVLSLPIDCVPGRTCFIQQYFDHDPGPGAKDYRCGGRVYDGHDGTDFRLLTVAAQRRGVAVLAAADGVVIAGRDGEADHLEVTDADRAAVKGRECGNGVLIEHADGWQTQYCHMAKGSLVVHVGQKVHAGDRLGLVGLSGDTEFPHLHLSVRQGKRKVDPFAPDLAPGACLTKPGPTLWSKRTAALLPYHATEIIALGFATQAVTVPEIQEERIQVPDAAAPAIVFYGRAIGLQTGDQVALRLVDPSGKVIFEGATPMDRPMAEWMSSGGHRRPATGWQRGVYLGDFRVIRHGGTAVEGKLALRL